MSITSHQHIWTEMKGWQPALPDDGRPAELVWLFGSRERLTDAVLLAEVAKAYSQAQIVGCSTAGEIWDTYVFDDSLVVTALHFEATTIQTVTVPLTQAEESYPAGATLAQSLNQAGLVHVIALSEGLQVNGSELVSGLIANLPPHVTVTGGLAADGDRFQHTVVLSGQQSQSNRIMAIGFYGERLKVGYGSLGGWDPFGPERLITRSKGNVLYELDNRPALELYKRYLGEQAKELPASGLLFPLALRTIENPNGLVRTILGVDESQQSLTFAGDMPQGIYARLMKANFDRLIDGALGAAQASYQTIPNSRPQFALLISCVGRKLVLKQRIEEEVEGVRAVLGQQATLAGFYSYGEISPFTPGAKCELHNQTMTITTFSEL